MSAYDEAIRSVKGFKEWVQSAKPGDFYIYHCGYLAYDREPAEGEIDVALTELADTALAYARTRTVHLVQRRVDYFTFLYIAIRRPNRRRL